MAIPAGVILIWTGTHATIPTGWSRETALDDKYPKAWGAAVAPNQTGGSNTHTHTGNHTHTDISHAASHLVAFNQTNGVGAANGGTLLAKSHAHTNTYTATMTGGNLQTTTVTWSSINQEPPYYTVIFVKPTGTVAALPAGICAHYYGTSAPVGWNFCDGANSTPDLRNKYLKGATTNANAGTTGGGTTHAHTVTHGHTADAHSHTGTSGTTTNTGDGAEDGGVTPSAQKYHTHTFWLDNNTDTISNYTNTTAGSTDTVEIAYKKLGVIKATVGSARKGMVGLWLGSAASIPINWVLCDGNNGTHDMRDKFVKIGATLAENNGTGGSNTHTHSAISHTHTSTGAHGHTGGTNVTTNIQSCGNGTGDVVYATHTHTLASVSTVTSTYNADNITVDTVNNEPAYRTAAYIQLNKIDAGGGFFFNLL